MKKSSRKALDVVIDTQIDYLLPSQASTYVPGAEAIIVPGLEWLCTRTESNSVGVLFTGNKFTESEYAESKMAQELPPHCLVGALGDYDPVGVQNVFSQRIMVSRGVPTFHLYKKTRSMWDVDADDNQATVHTFHGSAATAYNLQQFMHTTEILPVSLVNIWGVASDGAVRDAIVGFLLRGFKVNVVTNLCRGLRTEIDLAEDFPVELEEGKLICSAYAR